jgi:hypothetical protein
MLNLKLKDLKPDDWIIGENQFFEAIVRRVEAYKYDKNIEQDYTLTLENTVLSKCNYKYLTIKPEALEENTVIHCPVEWMSEALCWALDRLGYKWCNGEPYLADTRWKYYQEKTSYNFYDHRLGEYSYYKDLGFKIIPFWDAVTGEDVYMEKELKKVEFKNGDVVTDIITGKIGVIQEDDVSSLMVVFDTYDYFHVNTYGYEHENDAIRRVYHGKDIKITVTGEEIPIRMKTVWVNLYLYKNGLSSECCFYYESKEEALKMVITNPLIKYLKTISLEIPEEN